MTIALQEYVYFYFLRVLFFRAEKKRLCLTKWLPFLLGAFYRLTEGVLWVGRFCL
jgi:hypothetical protein